MRVPRIICRDEMLVPYSQALVYQTLCDFERYSCWWPTGLSFRVLGPVPVQVGTQIAMSNGPFVRWVALVADLQENRAILLHYSDGACRGNAAWTLVPRDGGTVVAYEIDVEVVPPWLRVLARFMDFSREHSRQMLLVFQELETELSRRTDNPPIPQADEEDVSSIPVTQRGRGRESAPPRESPNFVGQR